MTARLSRDVTRIALYSYQHYQVPSQSSVPSFVGRKPCPNSACLSHMLGLTQIFHNTRIEELLGFQCNLVFSGHNINNLVFYKYSWCIRKVHYLTKQRCCGWWGVTQKSSNTRLYTSTEWVPYL